MTRIKLVLLPLVVAGLSFGIAACGDDDSSSSDSGGGGETSLDLTIGDLIPLTGDLADFGPPGQKAADAGRRPDQRGDQRGRRRPHRDDRA